MGRKGLFYLFTWRLPAFADPEEGGGSDPVVRTFRCSTQWVSAIYILKCTQWLLWLRAWMQTVWPTRGRILGRNWDKSLKGFPPSYSQSPLLTDFTPPPPPLLAKVVLNGNRKSENLNEIARSWIQLQVCSPVRWQKSCCYAPKFAVILCTHCSEGPGKVKSKSKSFLLVRECVFYEAMRLICSGMWGGGV